jgi:hypothetical protein
MCVKLFDPLTINHVAWVRELSVVFPLFLFCFEGLIDCFLLRHLYLQTWHIIISRDGFVSNTAMLRYVTTCILSKFLLNKDQFRPNVFVAFRQNFEMNPYFFNI